MSRLKLKVNNCLLNNKEFFKLFNSIFNKIGYNCFIIFQDYLNIKILKYDENFEILWNFWVLKFYIFFLIFKFWILLKLLNFNFFFWKILTPYRWYITPLPIEYQPPTHGILTPLPMEYWPPTYGISNPLMVLWTPPFW